MADGKTGESIIDSSDEPIFDINAEARAHGGYLKLPQGEDETGLAYRDRIAGVLRAKGNVIEAHEVRSGRRFDDPEQGEFGTMTGIIGAVAQMSNDREYSPRDGVSQVGDDLAVGFLTQNVDRSGDALGAMFDLLGPGATVEILDATRPDRY